MRTRTPDGQPLEIDDSTLGAFRASLRGPLLHAGDHGYDEARTVWNAMFDRRPAFVVRAIGTSDVVAFVNFVREHGIAFSVKGGGHNVAGLAAIEGGAMLDLGLMRGVFVDRAQRSARVQGGALLGDVDRETQLHGLAGVMGFVSETGVAGLTLGGGFGYLTRRFGWTCDTLRSVDLVLADGRLVHASRKENPDLFWAVRGGGGNFGVAVAFDFDLFEVGPEIMGGAMAWPAEAAEEVFDVYRAVTAKAPRELAIAAGLRKAPPAPWLAPSIHGRDIALVAVCYTGDLEKADDADESPMGNRDAMGLFNVAASWESAADDEKNIAWARDTWQDLSRFSTGGAYINFQTDDEDATRMQAAYGPHLERLAHVKSIWDPHNLFRTNKNIAPGT